MVGEGAVILLHFADYIVVSKYGRESSVLPAEHFLGDRLQLLLHVFLGVEGELCI